jgi:hypothetical protein
MRTGIFLAMILFAMAANAGTLEKCEAAQPSAEGIEFCISAERSRSNNRLRELNPVVLAAINQNSPAARRKALLREYKRTQAQHVRKRQAVCRKQAAGNARAACEADMNFAHLDYLAVFTDKAKL